jgi:hypothetical protein
MVAPCRLGWLPAELLTDGCGEVAKLSALSQVDHRGAVELDRGVGGVDGVLERSGGPGGEADLGVGVTGL